jgi:DNA-binding Lrp family transcriptional regulator
MEVPRLIRKSFEKLRKESSGKIYLIPIKGRFYVYRESGKWDKEKKKTRIKSEYLGRILEDGTYVKKLASYSDDFEKAKALIAEKGGKIIWPAEGEGAMLPKESVEVSSDEIDMKLLTALSMNARASFATLGKLTGLSSSAAYTRVKSLEKRYGIKYTAEIDLDKLGYLTYLVLAKFQKEAPGMENLEAAAKNDPRIQLAFLSKGEYDIILFLLTGKDEKGAFSLYKAREELFPDRDARWYRAPVYITYNFIPMREEFFKVLKERVWKRSKENPKPPEGSISNGEYCVLYELVKDGAIDFSDIDKKYGFDKGMSQYTYHRLKEKQIIKRITISMVNLPVKYLAVLYLENTNDKNWEEAKAKLLAHMIKETNLPTDYYALVGDAGTPTGAIFVVPIFNEKNIEKAIEELKSIIKDASVTSSIVIGSINTPCFRKFDRAYSRQHNRLVESHGLRPLPKIKYE